MVTTGSTVIQDDVPPEKQADILPEVHELFHARWSPRAFSDQPVSDQDLKTILEAGRWAASCYNEQPWRFVVARKADRVSWERLLGVLEPFNQVWARTASVLIISAAKRAFSHNGTPNFHALHDAGAALAYMALQATALGLHTHAMAGFNHEKTRTELAVPDDFELGAALAIGYRGSVDDLPENLRERERATRSRKPLKEIAFNGRWEEPLNI